MIIRCIIVALVVGASTGCAHLMHQDPTEQLQKRVIAHWQAKEGKQWGRAYDYYCSDLKSEEDKARYIASSNLDITKIRVEKIVLSEDKQTAMVTIACDLIVQGIKFPGAKYREEWSYSHHDWCLSQKGDVNALFEKR